MKMKVYAVVFEDGGVEAIRSTEREAAQWIFDEMIKTADEGFDWKDEYECNTIDEMLELIMLSRTFNGYFISTCRDCVLS